MLNFVPKIEIVSLGEINGFDDASFPTRIYLERFLLLADKAYMLEGCDLSTLPWLQDVGLAPQETIVVPGDRLVQGLLRDQTMFADFRKRFSNGGHTVQFFSPTQDEVGFVAEAGLRWENTLSCDPEIAAPFADKAELRRMTLSDDWAGHDHCFPPFVLLNQHWSDEALDKALHDVRKSAEELGMSDVIVKRTDQVSGDGMKRMSEPGFNLFLAQQAGHPLIVEVFIEDHDAISIQYLIHDGEVIELSASRQIQEGLIHKGNIISSDNHVMAAQHTNQLRWLSRPFADLALARGYNGIIGFDAVHRPDLGLMFLTEANARVTATTFPIGVVRKLQRRLNSFNPWAVANEMFMAPSPKLRTFEDVRKALGHRLYLPCREHGVVPYMISGLRLKTKRRIGLMVIGNFAPSVEFLLAEAKQVLANY